MSLEVKLNKLYKEIAEQINDMIPVEWSRFYFNGEVKDKEGGVFFFYEPTDSKDSPIYSHDIPEIYQISEKAYDAELHKLFKLTVKLQQVFVNNNQEPWFSVTFLVSDTGKLSVNFDYTNWHNSDYGRTDRIDYFEYKYVGKNIEQFDLNLMKKMKEFEER